ALDPHGPLDLTRVASDVRAVLVEHGALVPELLEVGEAVPDVGVLGRVAQGLPLPAAPDEDRDVAGRGGVEPLPPAADPRQRLGEVREPRAGGAELVAVLGVVALEPAGADAEDETAAADVVDGPRHVGEQVGVAVAVARDERPDLRAARLLGPRAQHRPALEVL